MRPIPFLFPSNLYNSQLICCVTASHGLISRRKLAHLNPPRPTESHHTTKQPDPERSPRQPHNWQLNCCVTASHGHIVRRQPILLRAHLGARLRCHGWHEMALGGTPFKNSPSLPTRGSQHGTTPAGRTPRKRGAKQSNIVEERGLGCGISLRRTAQRNDSK